MFVGFDEFVTDVGETRLFGRRKGAGPALVLLHGFPETHLMWRDVAAELARDFTVVCPDLRGYGASGKPASSPDHATYAKRALALDIVRLMESHGFERFCVAGHDRGGRVAYRLALDHPERVERLAVLDLIPTAEAFDRADARFALAFWPWSLLAQPSPLPERLVSGDPAAVIDSALAGWGSDAESFPSGVREAYIDALRDPASVHAICEEYRAAATLDRDIDRADREANRQIRAPLLVLWSAGGALDAWYGADGGPLAIWRSWAPDVHGRAIAGGHFFPEQNPIETSRELRGFFNPSESKYPVCRPHQSSASSRAGQLKQ
jgi:haloacetate dehalogenase